MQQENETPRIDSPAAFKAARRRMGLTQEALASRLRLAQPNGARTVRRIEAGDQSITGPMSLAMEKLLDDWKRAAT